MAVIDIIHLERSGAQPIVIWLADILGLEKIVSSQSFMHQYPNAEIHLFHDIASSQVEKYLKVRIQPTLIVMRDPYNWLASKIRFLGGNVISQQKIFIKESIEQWLTYARTIENYPMSDNIAWVNYNEWASSIEYRVAFAKSFGVTEMVGRSEKRIPINNQGSAFDFRIYEDRADEMKVLERWKTMTSVREYKEVFTDEVVHYSELLFNLKRPW